MSLYRGPAPRLVASLAMALLGINHINRIYDATYHRGKKCAESLLSILGTTYKVGEADLANIPRTGPCVIVANHPTGGLDGVLLIDMLSKVRDDVKFIGNFILQKVESLNSYFIPVNPYSAHDPKGNVKGVKMAADHILTGGALVIFPAGQVSEWQKDLGRVADGTWRRSVMRFIHNSGAPVVPVYIDAQNSRRFYMLCGLHPFIKSAMLPREFINKRHMTIPVRIGPPVTVDPAMSANQLADTLRKKVYDLPST